MTIGVAITSYNYGHLLAQAIESVLGQTRKVDQILIVDDASFDMSAGIAKLYNLPFIQRSVNLGTQKNFHKILMEEMHTDLMMFLGADNWLHPKYLELTEQKINDKIKVVGTDCFIVGEYAKKISKLAVVHNWHADKEGYPVWSYKKTDILKDNYIHGSALFDLEVARRIGGFKDDRVIDYDLWKAFFRAGYELEVINEPLLYYRKHRFNFNQKEIKMI